MSTLHKVLLCVAALCLAAALLPRFDGSPPELSWAEPPPEVVAGDAELAVLASDRRPGIRAVEASLDGSPLQVDEVGGGRWLVHIRSGGLEDGPHSLEVVAIDRSFRRHRSVLRHEVLTDNSPPQVQVARSSRRAAQGKTLAVFLRFDEPVEDPTVQLFGTSGELRETDAGWVALFGVPVGQEPGDYNARVRAPDIPGNVAELDFTVAVEATDFPQGGFVQLTAAQTAARQDHEAIEASRSRRRAAHTAAQSELLWSGLLDRPCPGPVSSPFGKVRTYSDGKTRHHLGTDIAAPRGTVVVAPAGGTVTLSEELAIYGEAVIVKHGPQLSTSYSHLSRRDVQVGDRVERGEPLGLVGSTGQSTGPHLHWGLVVRGATVAAEEWLERDFGRPAPGDFD